MKNIFSGDELKQLLADPFRSYRRQLAKEDLVANGCIVYGAGTMGKILISCLLDIGVSPICCVDKNQAIEGSSIMGTVVRQPAELLNHPHSYVLIASSYVNSITRANPYLADKKVFLWSAINNFCPIVPEMPDSVHDFLDNQEVRQAYDLMADEKSQKVFKNFINYHILYDTDFYLENEPGCYFPHDLALNHHQFIDAGAANGDTLKVWLEHGFPQAPDDFYYAFEPNFKEFLDLDKYVGGLAPQVGQRVKLFRAGLGDANTTLYLSDAGTGSRLADRAFDAEENRAGSNVKIVKLDDALGDECPTLIKADVEGFELQLLEGAKGTIHRCWPDLAISAYHRYTDLWRIPLWINRQNPDYKLFLRSHYQTYGDVVCYALSPK